MADLSAYIAFSVNLSKSPATSAMVFTDPDGYPPGVDINLKGYFNITQPDGITLTGSFGSPDIYYSGSGLVTASKELRLRYTGGFQQGLYTFEYHVIAPGYNETILTKTFTLAYTSPTLTVSSDFDVFTPDLSLTDDTVFTQAGMTLNTVTRAWEADIITVSGTPQTITGSLQTFDLNYLGNYYDSRYDASLTATVTYTLSSPNTWVTISDTEVFTHTYYAFIPLSLDDLLQLLTDYKIQLDTAGCICGTGCCSNCSILKSTYTLAAALYIHIVERGRLGEVDGLGEYVLQLQKLLSNCITPAYTNTNAIIPPYNWATIPGSGTVTSFAAGNLPPLFTTNVTSPTTTPTLSFVLTNAPANTVFGNLTGSAAAPGFQPLVFTRVVIPKTVNYSLNTTTDVNQVFTNEGAGAGVTLFLPPAAANLIYSFYVQNANGLTITAGTGDTVRIGLNVTPTAGSVSSPDVGSAITFLAINATEWISLGYDGTWIV